MSNLAAQELQSFVRRIEALDDEIRALNSDKSEVFKEVKGAGFTAKTLRKVVAARRMDAAERDEADTEFELYWNAVHGIELDDVRAHVENIEEFPAHDEDGVILEDELPPASRGYVGEDDLREPAATVRGQIAQEGDAPLETAANANGEGMSGHAAHLSTDLPPVASDQHVEANTANGLAEPAYLPAEAVANTKSAPIAFVQKPLRPYCLNTDKCGGQGRKHCWTCQKTHDEKQGAA